ncbi:PREDICTED: SLAM family member 6 [Elephantulus edwardii]|uniref:SLAM family member 6 n=1 Tax=Elephantulus edwardii TaxID=28737 RepID=UPI0003F065AA|nr:PREDICTED: SLAM family member 6 [Elephantulus edwardii]
MTINGVLGESISLPLMLPVEEKIESIIWQHEKTPLTFSQPYKTICLEFFVTFPERKEQLNVTRDCSLQLTNLMMNDRGSYRAQVASNSSKTYYYMLNIFERLQKVNIAYNFTLSENETCEIQMFCSVENPNGNVLFIWQPSRQMGPNLTISWDPKNSRKQNYTCIAENPVSNSSFSITTERFCKGVFHPSVSQTECSGELPDVLLPIIKQIGKGWKRKGAGQRMEGCDRRDYDVISQAEYYTQNAGGDDLQLNVYPFLDLQCSP